MLTSFLSSTSSSFLSYCLLGLLTLVEGPLASLAGGAASSSGLLLPLPVYASVVLGNLLADLGWYSLGRFGQLSWLQHLAPRVGLRPERVTTLAGQVHRHAPRLIFLSKLTVGFPIPTLVATGLSRVPLRRWGLAWLLGELLKSAVLVSFGYFYARALQQVSATLQTVLWGLTALILLAALLFFKRRTPTSTPDPFS